jgi:hypothetical protein
VLRRFWGRRSWLEIEKTTRRTRWQGCGPEIGVREGEMGGETSGRPRVTLVRNIDRQERQSAAIGLGLVPVEVGEHYGPLPGH